MSRFESEGVPVTTRWIDLEGGFWGLVGDDGQQYEPVSGLPDQLRTEGSRFLARLRAVPVFSVRMWGTPVNVEVLD